MALVDGDRCPMTVQLEAAHIVPYSKNGTDDPSNGITLCRPHHLAVDRALFTPPPDDDTYLA
jgi:predicted restriction endonuclease